ncbi:mitogen-activated protein kinase kinase kinase 14 isoform X2 [Oncorhynchus keta]|uniref:mitogen-activated protein kinase kinase kinase 14 isoform X2 n=1 Tax=Oncorhynchus keta TaxID=8018 RepID=UPI00227ABDA9|nr:mitogen-activated protein kinase kinase kinase 14 isoform X2 [Oncorhynchus keta]
MEACTVCGSVQNATQVRMAVNQRIFNSTRPFSGSPQIELKGSYPSLPSPEDRTSDEEGKESEGDFMACLKPRLIQVLTQGTAEQVGEAGPLNYQKNSFIAQAECETQDSQQFSPSCSERSYVGSPNCLINRDSSEHNNVACSTAASNQDQPGSPAHCSPRKKPRKKQKRKEKKEEQRETGKQRQRRRVPSGVPEQETQTGSSPQLIQTQEDASEPLSNISTSYSSSIPSLEAHDTRRPPYPLQDCNRGPSHSHPCWGPQVFSPSCNLSTYGQESDSDSPLSSVGDCSLALAGLRGSVSQEDRCYAGPFCKDVERHVWEKEGEVSETDTNEGLIFNENIQPVNYEYREGKDYSLCKSINTGSYGEVHSVQDNRTHFRFCAKKILLKSFSSEEVGTWSALKSPRVVELFGVIREGPYVVLFMDLKAGSVGQLIKERGRLPEDLALHYHCQVLGALEHLLKRRVLHLDIKADNVLLSEDGRDTFLCDFGHSERMDIGGQSLSASQGDLKGTETHMAPEIVKGETRGAKADVWSSCCMLLHMLNGCQPWTRYYSRPLLFKIANEPPPLREIPPDCSPFTADVIKVGLQKEPTKRASAPELKGRAARALREVGGLTSPIRGSYKEPLQIDDSPGQSSQPWPPFSRDTCSEENHKLLLESMNPGSRELNNDEEEGSEADTEETTSPPDSPRSLLTQLHEWQNPKMADVTSNVSELELRKLEREFYLTSLSQLHSAETQEQLLSCLSSSDCYSNRDLWDRKDSGRWSISPGDDLSSGVFSYNSQPDGQILSMDWLVHQSHLSPPRCFEGVDVCITDVNGQSIRIREKRRVKVGHIATGISDQISERVFTMETQERVPVAHDEEVQDSGLLLRCVPAPDYSQAWRWRVKEGVLETRD